MGFVRAAAFATVFFAVPTVTFAQTAYPTRTIKIIVPIPPGPVADALPRLLAEKLAVRWGQPVIVENRPGAALTLGAEAVAKATPDAYTLLATPPSPLAINQSFFAKLGYDANAFVPVSIFASLPYVLVVNPKIPVSTLPELIAYAKANPNKLNFAAGGTGGGPHLTGEMLKQAASIRMVNVPYPGLGPAMTDLLAGHVDLLVDNLGNVLPRVREGKLKALGVGSETRVAELPNVPAIAEMFPGFRAMAWFAIVAPPKTPADIAAKISQAVAEALRLPDVAKHFRNLSITPVGSSPAETAEFLKDETERWRKVIVAGGIKPD